MRRELTALFCFCGLCGAPAVRAAPAEAARADDAPKLVFGVLSDVHVDFNDRGARLFEKRFRRALAFLDARKVDAVLSCGDMVELGWHDWYRRMAAIWFEVFPDNRRSDGQPVEKLILYGDHEIENFWNPNITRAYSREYVAAHDIPRYGRARNYEEAWREPWAPIMRKTVKGYDFVLAHFTMRENGRGESADDGRIARWGEYVPGLKEFFATNRFDASRPFFYAQHKPIKETVISPKVGGQTDGSTRAILENHPNCFAFCGHKHKSATSERSLWQGAFTCVEAPALQTVQTDAGHENGWASCDGYVPSVPPQQMARVDPARDGGQLLIVKVHADRLVYERWNAVFEEKVAADWVVPFPLTAARPMSWAARAAKLPPPAFPAGAEVKVARGPGADRTGATNEQYVVTFPRAASDEAHARGYDYRVTARLTKHFWTRTACEKFVYSDKCYLPEPRDVNVVTCLFSAAELPVPYEGVQFTVTPQNAFGRAGAPIASRVYAPAAVPRRR